MESRGSGTPPTRNGSAHTTGGRGLQALETPIGMHLLTVPEFTRALWGSGAFRIPVPPPTAGVRCTGHPLPAAVRHPRCTPLGLAAPSGSRLRRCRPQATAPVAPAPSAPVPRAPSAARPTNSTWSAATLRRRRSAAANIRRPRHRKWRATTTSAGAIATATAAAATTSLPMRCSCRSAASRRQLGTPPVAPLVAPMAAAACWTHVCLRHCGCGTCGCDCTLLLRQ